MAADDRRERRDAGKPEVDESFVDEELIPVLIVGGVLLFLFPEPTTSALGIVLVGIGVGLWLQDIVS